MVWFARVLLLLWPLSAACGSDDPPAPDAGPSLDAGQDGGLDAAVDAAPPPPPLRIDGLFEDWAGAALLAEDPAGDAEGAFDVTTLHARSHGAVLALRLDVGAVRNLNAGAEADGTLRLELVLPSDRHLTIDHRALDPRLDGRALLWEDLRYEAAPTHSSDVFEIAMDLSGVGVAPGDRVTIDVGGSDRLPAPVPFVLDGPPAPAAVRRGTEREAGTTVRIASLNTLQSGLFPGSRRRAAILRVLGAVDADVYCLQEDYDNPVPDLAVLFAELRGDGSEWNVVKVRDNVIASPYPLTAVPSEHERYAAAIVDLPEAGALLLVSVHLSCCGWDGNLDDSYRIDEAAGIVRTIEAALDGDDLPVVVIGDWNLVGSREPLDVVLDPGGLALEHWLLPQLIGEHVMTWHSSASFYPPGILDLVVHSPDGLVRRNGFVLEESLLDDAERAALGLEPEDGLATDHLPLVVDFEVVPTR